MVGTSEAVPHGQGILVQAYKAGQLPVCPDPAARSRPQHGQVGSFSIIPSMRLD